MKHELILEQLKIMGFDPVCIDDEKYLFEYKEMKFILTNDSDNEDFLSISIPWVYELTEENKKQFLIPRGFAHGFVVVSDYAEFAYKCDEFYHPEDEGGVMYDSCGIEWPKVEGEVVLSEKDLKHPKLEELDFKFKI